MVYSQLRFSTVVLCLYQIWNAVSSSLLMFWVVRFKDIVLTGVPAKLAELERYSSSFVRYAGFNELLIFPDTCFTYVFSVFSDLGLCMLLAPDQTEFFLCWQEHTLSFNSLIKNNFSLQHKYEYLKISHMCCALYPRPDVCLHSLIILPSVVILHWFILHIVVLTVA